MPIFGYECTACGERFELLETCKDKNRNYRCPHCGAQKPSEHEYRICRYWKEMLGSPDARYIRPGSWT